MTAPPRDRPRVSVNFAITWDGRIAARTQSGANFSSPCDKRRLLEIRAEADAVLVSARTVAADRMTMGMPVAALRAAREARGRPAYPLRVLVSHSGRIDPALPVFEKTFSPLLVFSTKRMPKKVQVALQSKAELHLAIDDQVDLPEMMRVLRREYRVRRLDCEGGGRLFYALLAHHMVDEIHLTLCPRIFGGLRGPTLTGEAGAFLPKSTQAELKEMKVVGGECFLRYAVRRPLPTR